MKPFLIKKIYQVLLCISLSVCISQIVKAQTWAPIGLNSNSSVNDLVLDSASGILYAGGQFLSAGSVTSNIALRVGTQWDSLGSGMNGAVKALIIFNGDLYAAGFFTIAGGDTANYIARWDGTNWYPLGSGTNGSVFALAEYNNELYAAGNFTTAGGVSANYIAKWDGSNWSSLGVGCNVLIWDIITFNGHLYAGGFFTSAGGVSANRIAKWDGSNWSALGSGTNSVVYSFGIHEGELLVGGDFTQAGGINANRIAKWNGSSFEALGVGLDASPYEIESYNCEMYVSGNFTTAGGLAVTKIAKYNPIGGWSAITLPIDSLSFGSIDVLKSYNGNLYTAGNIISPNGNIQLYNLPVPALPVAAFNSSQTVSHYGEYIQFFSMGADAVNFNWSFPGGVPATSLEKNPKIFYPTVGDFDATLIASNCQGSDTLSYASYIHIDSLNHAIPFGNSSDFITMSTPPNTANYYGDYHVYYYKPATYDSLTSPILFYIHGQGGTGAGNTDLIDIADRQNAMIVSPTMHPSYGYVRDIAYDSITGCHHRIFMTEVMKQIYRHVLYREQRPSMDAYLTGFSEGGQFTTRYMLVRQFSPDSIPIKMAVSVNPANYTLMTDTFNGAAMDWLNYRCGLAGFDRFVYGCIAQQNIPVSDFICNEHIIQYFNENYGILIGTADTQPFPSFCGYATGTDRYDRAKVFHTFSTIDAIARGTTLQWVFDSVQFIGHSNYWMYRSKLNVTDTFTIAENLLFNTPYHSVPQLTPSCIPTGINEAATGNDYGAVYPNPSSGIFHLDVNKTAVNSELKIYNSVGQILLTQRITSGTNTINLSSHTSGMYFYSIQQTNKVLARGKFIIVTEY
ncbi:MAG: T9SS type A sorting domain-containing protein [Bacteroidia bacterium]